MHLSEIDNIVFEGVDFETDPPNISNSFILYADYFGVPMTENQLEEINKNSEFVYEQLMERLN